MRAEVLSKGSGDDMPLPCRMSVNFSVLWFWVHRMRAAPIPLSFVFSDVLGSWMPPNSFMVLIFVALGNAQWQMLDINCWMSVLCKASVFEHCSWLAQGICRISFALLSTNTLFSIWLLLQWYGLVEVLHFTHGCGCHKGAQVVTDYTGGSLWVVVGFSTCLHPDSAWGQTLWAPP